MVNPPLNLPNSYVTRDKSIEYTHGNNTASYLYTTAGTGEDEKAFEVILDMGFGKVFDLLGKNSAENYAYNWYLGM